MKQFLYPVLMAPVIAFSGSTFACPPEEEEVAAVERAIVALKKLPEARLAALEPALAVLDDKARVEAHQILLENLQDGGKSTATIVITNENGELKVVKQGDSYDIRHNGEKVSDERVEIRADRLIVRDKDGETTWEIAVTPHGGMGFGVAPQEFAWVTAAPKGRIGVSMSALDEALATQLGVDNHNAFIISEVVEGGPAARAGLKKHDIVVRVDGQTASQDLLRERVATGEPGRQIKLRIIRGGEPKDLSVTVEPGDHAVGVEGLHQHLLKLGEEGTFTFDIDADFDFGEIHDRLVRIQPEWAEAQGFLRTIPRLQELKFDEEHLRKMKQTLHEHLKQLDLSEEKIREIEETVKSALQNVPVDIEAHITQLRGEHAPVVFDLLKGKQEGEHVMILPQIAKDALTESVTFKRQGDDTAARLQRIEERLSHIEALLEKLAARFNERP